MIFVDWAVSREVYMSLGGFTSLIRIVRTTVSGGLYDTGTSYSKAEMELEAVLTAFDYCDLPKRLPSNTKTFLSVKVEFSEADVRSSDVDDDQPYIGQIQLRDRAKDKFYENDEMDIRCSVDVVLPAAMLQQLRSMDGRCIQFETIHDVIQEPTKEQQTDHIVAFVKRCYFEVGEEIDDMERKLRLHR